MAEVRSWTLQIKDGRVLSERSGLRMDAENVEVLAKADLQPLVEELKKHSCGGSRCDIACGAISKFLKAWDSTDGKG